MTGSCSAVSLQALIVILGVILIIFFLAQLIPGGEAKAVLGAKATPAGIARFNRLNGLDQPLWVQFWQYIERIFAAPEPRLLVQVQPGRRARSSGSGCPRR